MYLGVSYNAFNGIDLITSSINSVRSSVDYISVIVQDKSNFGIPFADNDRDILMDLRRNKVIDELLQVNIVKGQDPHVTEIRKRQVGYNYAFNAECTHFMSMDVDEYFKKDELDNAKQYIEDNNIDGSFCKYINYYGDLNHQMPYEEGAFVPLIYKIHEGNKFIFGNSLTRKVVCDPTRQMPCNRVAFMDDITMHHMSYVRYGADGFRSKLSNSSANRNWNKGIEDTMVDYYSNWKHGMDGMMINASPRTQGRDAKVVKVPLKEVDNEFK